MVPSGVRPPPLHSLPTQKMCYATLTHYNCGPTVLHIHAVQRTDICTDVGYGYQREEDCPSVFTFKKPRQMDVPCLDCWIAQLANQKNVFASYDEEKKRLLLRSYSVRAPDSAKYESLEHGLGRKKSRRSRRRKIAFGEWVKCIYDPASGAAR